LQIQIRFQQICLSSSKKKNCILFFATWRFGATTGDVIGDYTWGACNYKGNAGNTEIQKWGKNAHFV